MCKKIIFDEKCQNSIVPLQQKLKNGGIMNNTFFTQDVIDFINELDLELDIPQNAAA